MEIIIMAYIHKYLKALGREVKRGRPSVTVSAGTKRKLIRLYLDEGLSIREVTARLGIASSSVRRRLKAAGIERRSKAPRPMRKRKVSLHIKGDSSNTILK